MTDKNISKTAKQAIQAGAGFVKQAAKGWIFERIPGKLQTRPYKTFFKDGEAATYVAANGGESRFILVQWTDVRRK